MEDNTKKFTGKIYKSPENVICYNYTYHYINNKRLSLCLTFSHNTAPRRTDTEAQNCYSITQLQTAKL